MSSKVRLWNKVYSCLAVGCGGGLVFAAINVYKGNDRFYRELLMPALHSVTAAETAHTLAIKLAKYGFVPKLKEDPTLTPILKTNLWDIEFDNPIGLAAGFDKDGQAIRGLAKLGFGFIEVGSCTPEPQSGNEKPRVFRLIRDKAIINRYGFNSAGHEVVKSNIENAGNIDKVVIGLNLGKNKSSADSAQDFIKGMVKFSAMKSIGYYVINISSPNTQNLRELQNKRELIELIERVLKVRNKQNIEKPLLVKIAPDLTDSQLKDIANIVIKFATNKSIRGIDGLVVSNTTIERPVCLKSNETEIGEPGGLSGLPLKEKSTEMIRKVYKLTKGTVPIIGVGGVFTGEDAYDKIKAGASLVQIYTALTYEGPQIVEKIKRELAHNLKSNGFENISEAIGTDHK